MVIWGQFLVLPSNETLVPIFQLDKCHFPPGCALRAPFKLYSSWSTNLIFQIPAPFFTLPWFLTTEYILWGHRGKLTLDFHQRDLLELIGETEIWVKLPFNSNNQTEVKAVRRYFTMIVVTTTVRFSIAELSLDKVFSFWTNTSLSMSFQ